jgi:hypothetical protein
MSDALIAEPTDVYEPPLLVEVGDYTELTCGTDYNLFEGPNTFTWP